MTNRFYSALSMFVFDTDSPWVDVEYYTTNAAVDVRYGAIAVAKSTTAAVKPTTTLALVEPIAVVGRHRSGRISTGATIGAGAIRIYLINGGLSGFVGAQCQRAWIADGASLSIQTESPTGRTFGFEGWGSAKFGGITGAIGEGFGYAVVGGVLQGGNYATRRTEHLDRLARHAPGSGDLLAVMSAFTNDITVGMSASDMSVSMASWFSDVQTAFPAARIVWITTLRRWNEIGIPARRTAEEAACGAAGVDFIDGLTLGTQNLTYGDMSTSPDVHPNDLGHVKLAGALHDYYVAEGITGRVIGVGNSIFDGSGEQSSGPDAGLQIYAATQGAGALLRASL